jgi:hypothetical protein
MNPFAKSAIGLSNTYLQTKIPNYSMNRMLSIAISGVFFRI